MLVNTVPTTALRKEDVESWFSPLSAAVGLPFRLLSASGEEIASHGELEGPLQHLPVTADGIAVAELQVGAGAPTSLTGAAATALCGLAETRGAIQDMARSLARAWQEINFLADLGRMLGDAFDLEPVAPAIVEQLVRILRAERGWLELERDGRTVCVAAHPPEAPGSEGACRIRAALVDGDRPRGALVFEGPPTLEHSANLLFLSHVATQLVQALRFRRHLRLQLEAAALHRDLAVAAEIQRGLLPQGRPVVEGAALAGVCRMAEAVGGDGFDFLPFKGGLDLVVADVSGHGLGAGLLLSSFLGKLRMLEPEALAPATIAERVNGHLCREVGVSGNYVTAVYARLSQSSGRLDYTTMGHYAPLLWRDGQVRQLPSTSGLPAGMHQPGWYDQASVALEVGDVLLFFTDGLVEARSAEGAMFGMKGLEAAFGAAAPREPEAVLNGIFEAVEAFTGLVPRPDDQTAVVVRVRPAAEED